jgi:glycerol-3-phosphate dehydrogenase
VVIRELKGMSEKKYDLVIIGGGITGALVAWDASLRGISIALLEKDDFAHATSSATSKMIHGGLRYLKNLELGLVRESLRERRIMEIITPHFIFPIPFVMPMHGWGIDKRLLIKTGLIMYDLLAYDKGNLEDRDKRIPNHTILSSQEVMELFPDVETDHLRGGAVFYDCVVHTPERHTLEFILSAAARGADIANYAAVIDILREGNRVTGVRVKDRSDGKEYEIGGRVTVNVTGPWGDITLGMLHRDGIEKKLVRSKGIHLITRPLTRRYALGMTKEKSRVSIMPWRNRSLIGITDRVYEGDPDNFKVSEDDIMGLLADVNESYPAAGLRRSDVLYFYGGLRPIVEKETTVDVYDASRRYEIYDHERDDGIMNFITAIGGKYTTSRNLARKVIDLVYKKLDMRSPDCKTESTPTIGGAMGFFRAYLKNELLKRNGEYPKDIIENLIYNYGTEYGRVLGMVDRNDVLKMRILNDRPDILAQVAYAVTEEMALHLDDVLFRRTGIGTLGNPGATAIQKCADIMSDLLGWNGEEREREIRWALTYYTPLAKDGDIPPVKGGVRD